MMSNKKFLRHSVVTTWHPAGYEKYGKSFIDTYLLNWPKSVHLTIYAENHVPDIKDRPDRITVLDQATSLPSLMQWQFRHKDNDSAHGWNKSHTEQRFLWDASRFANKTFAVWDHVRKTPADIAIWCDGDVITHSKIPDDFLESISPSDEQLCTYLGRKTWPECGWIMYNTKHLKISSFINEWEKLYLDDEIFNHDEYHDCFSFDILVKKYSAAGVKFKNLGGDDIGGHVFIKSPLGAYMDHLKGFRKETGHSLVTDISSDFAHSNIDWWKNKAVKQTSSQIEHEKMKSPIEYDLAGHKKSKKK